MTKTFTITMGILAMLSACGDDGSGLSDGGLDDLFNTTVCKTSLNCVDNSGGKTICGVGYECVQCVFAADCGGGKATCNHNSCVPIVTCKNSLDCRGDEVCNGATQRCVECVVSADCKGDEDRACVANVCQMSCNSDNDCTPLGLLCDVAAEHCVQCVQTRDCAGGLMCLGGQCAECMQARDCRPGELCTGGRCEVESCEPIACPALACGLQANRCGGTMDCGPCDESCDPLTCRDIGIDACGTQLDSCNGLIDCGSCETPTEACDDGSRNWNETDVDCGGDTCDQCVIGQACDVAEDCLSGNCDGVVCIAPPAEGSCGFGQGEIGRYAEWCGKVNVHIEDSVWVPDCSSGCGMDPVTYCKKYYVFTVAAYSVTPAGEKPFATAGCAEDYPSVGEKEFICCGTL